MDSYEKYFEAGSQKWLDESYNQYGYNYPVGKRRLELLSNILSDYENYKLRVLDLGCGGGDVSIWLAEQGHSVMGVDRSSAMLNTCIERQSNLAADVSERLTFMTCDFDEIELVLQEQTFDLVIGFGFVGYLESPEYLFKKVKPLVKDEGLIVLSWRNQLFNLYPGSKYLSSQLESGTDYELGMEIEKCLISPISSSDMKAFLMKLKDNLNKIDLETLEFDSCEDSKSEVAENQLNVEAKQHHVGIMKTAAKNCGFSMRSLYGVHPHLLPANFNEKLPPGVYNMLSESLTILNHTNMAQTWSSVSVAVFVKSCD